jgi:membrane protein DedA with SNARE-associated domain
MTGYLIRMSLLQNFIQDYGYLTVFLGAMVEGESVIITASALAATGMLSIGWVMLVTFLGTLFADQAIYLLGLRYGPSAVRRLRTRFPKLEPHIDKGLLFLKRKETFYILSFRFIYGIRVISPFLIGAQGVPFKRFSLLNLLSAFIWTVISCLFGYFLGALLGDMITHVEWLVAGILIGVFLVGHWFSKRKKQEP